MRLSGLYLVREGWKVILGSFRKFLNCVGGEGHEGNFRKIAVNLFKEDVIARFLSLVTESIRLECEGIAPHEMAVGFLESEYVLKGLTHMAEEYLRNGRYELKHKLYEEMGQGCFRKRSLRPEVN